MASIASASGSSRNGSTATASPTSRCLFDVPTGVSRERLDRSQAEGRTLDKFEREAEAFFDRVRGAYLERAKADPQRFRVIDSTRSLSEVRALLDAHLDALAARGR